MPIRVGFEILPDAAKLRIMLDALVKLDLLELSRNRFPPLYRAEVRYQREPLFQGRFEQWKPISQIIRDGHGDCEDLACWRTAELKQAKVNAKPWLIKHGTIWHVVVKLPDGSIEDPSRRLGMGGQKGR